MAGEATGPCGSFHGVPAGRRAVRILFVSGTSEGGSARSTEQLAARLHTRGHDIATLMGWRPRPTPRQVEPDGGWGPYAALATHARRVDRIVRRQLDRGPRRVDRSIYPSWQARFPGRSLAAVWAHHRPDVVVATSLDPRTWRSTCAHLAAEDTASVFYVRAEDTVRWLCDGPLPDLVLCNAQSLAGAVQGRGVRANVVPSVVELDRYRTESTRQRVLFVNPIALRGLNTALALARARPQIPFVVHETGPLSGRDRARLRAHVSSLPNVEIRKAVADPGALYRDARILLAPYMVSNRPRVVLEAHSNGIPVLAADIGGLRECVPPGGQLVAPDAPVDGWVRALDEMWDDSARYAALAEAARRHSERPEVQPATIVAQFEAAMESLLVGRRQRSSARS